MDRWHVARDLCGGYTPHLRSLIIAESDLRIVLSFLDCLDLPGSALVHLSDMYIDQDPTPIRIPTFSLLISLERLELFAVKRFLHLVAGPSEAYDSSRPFRAGFTGTDRTLETMALRATHYVPAVLDPHTACLYPGPRALREHPPAHVTPRRARRTLLRFERRPLGALHQPLVCGSEKICCPRLRVLCLETHVNPEAMPCYSMIADMAAMRKHLGHPLQRVAICAVLPRPWEDQQGVAMLFRGVFSCLGLCVETVKCRGAGDDSSCPFSMHRRWEAADADADGSKGWDVEPPSE